VSDVEFNAPPGTIQVISEADTKVHDDACVLKNNNKTKESNILCWLADAGRRKRLAMEQQR